MFQKGTNGRCESAIARVNPLRHFSLYTICLRFGMQGFLVSLIKNIKLDD